MNEEELSDEPENESPDLQQELSQWWQEFFLPTIESTQLRDRIWCPQWREHPEAVEKVYALWTSHMAAVSSPNELAGWWVNSFEPIIDKLTHRNGIFRNCETGHNGPELLQLGPEDELIPLPYSGK